MTETQQEVRRVASINDQATEAFVAMQGVVTDEEIERERMSNERKFGIRRREGVG